MAERRKEQAMIKYKWFTCDVKITFTNNSMQAWDVEDYKRRVIESFERQFPSIGITEDEIHNIKEKIDE